MNYKIRDKLALVTGAGKGIGKAISKALAREGVKLILISRSKSDLCTIINEVGGISGIHQIFELDLMNYEATEKIIYQIEKEMHPDIIVNSVGGSLGVSSVLAEYSDWERVWRLNTGITIQINNTLIPKLIQKKWGRIVNITTTSTVSQTYTGNPPYISAKAALNAYSKSLSRELAKSGIVVASVAPGAIHTQGRYLANLAENAPEELQKYFNDHLPANRLGTAEDVAEVVTFLCSESSAFCSGSIIQVDGGAL